MPGQSDSKTSLAQHLSEQLRKRGVSVPDNVPTEIVDILDTVTEEEFRKTARSTPPTSFTAKPR